MISFKFHETQSVTLLAGFAIFRFENSAQEFIMLRFDEFWSAYGGYLLQYRQLLVVECQVERLPGLEGTYPIFFKKLAKVADQLTAVGRSFLIATHFRRQFSKIVCPRWILAKNFKHNSV